MRITETLAGQYQQNSGQQKDKRKRQKPAAPSLPGPSTRVRNDTVSISDSGFELENLESDRNLVKGYLDHLNNLTRNTTRIRHRINSDRYNLARAIENLLTEATGLPI